MTRINVCGDFFSATGYASHCRGLVRALKKLNDMTSCETQMPGDWLKMVDDLSFSILSKPVLDDSWQLLITSPLMTSFKLVEKNRGVLPFMIFEGDKAPKQWAIIANDSRVRKVLVPSVHNKEALINAGVIPEKIAIIPHGYDPLVFHEKLIPLPDIVNAQKCTFLWNKGWSKGTSDRSGFDKVLHAFSEEFGHDECVRLVAHINPVYNKAGYDIEAEITKLGLPSKEQRAELVITNSLMSENDMARFYASGDFFIGTSRAESFNLPVLEAMACGIPPLITTFGGMIDYVPENLGWRIGGVLQSPLNLDFQEKAIYEQTRWLELSIPELRNAMRAAFNLWKETPEQYQIMKNKSRNAAQSWTWNDSAQKLITLLNQLEGNA